MMGKSRVVPEGIYVSAQKLIPPVWLGFSCTAIKAGRTEVVYVQVRSQDCVKCRWGTRQD